MIEKLTRFDIGILVAAAAMAIGAFCPIVHLPIVGSMNYVMGGRADGVFVVGCAGAIIVLVISGYRRTTGIIAAGALFTMLTTLVPLAEKLSEARAGIEKGMGPFSGLGILMANSVGLGWGWLLLVGGALSVIVIVLIMPSGGVARKPAVDRSFSSADKLIADYIENRKISPAARNQAMPRQSGFGKRLNH
jgi:hypothetical protein